MRLDVYLNLGFNLNLNMLDDILSQVNKPGRYIGQERNAYGKNFDKANIKFALCFPELYEVGMSNLGIRILYGVLNNIEDVSCERFFSCAQDMENILRERRLAALSLESGRGLREFDLVGFSLSCELNYTNVLNMLDLSCIPLKSSLRNQSYPLVIGGGPCVLNPEPMHEFFDLFVFGEAEEVILEVIDIYRKFKGQFNTAQISKKDLLIMLSNIEGIYVPSLYNVTYNTLGGIEEFKPVTSGVPIKIRKRFVEDLDSAYFPLEWLVPYIQIVHDRITLEIMRGCPNSCRFCQARAQYFPFRQRGVEKVLELACQTLKSTGYEGISLCGLSVSDYVGIEELLGRLVYLYKENGVSVSLPSIKPKKLVGTLSSLIANIKKTGLTFAPEAATERMRKVINKNFELHDFFKALEQAYHSGYQRVKLYFMVGLPSEQQGDLDAILDFAASVSELRRKIKQSPAQVNMSINTLIPKPHTSFQWLEMLDIDGIKQKQGYLKMRVKNNRLKLSFANPYMSFLEGVLSRGDRRLSQVILRAFSKGARFDAWGDNFVFTRWIDACGESGIDPNFYLKDKPKDAVLPWDFLDTGIRKDRLIAEANVIKRLAG